jgi:hypothetical protein
VSSRSASPASSRVSRRSTRVNKSAASSGRSAASSALQMAGAAQQVEQAEAVAREHPGEREGRGDPRRGAVSNAKQAEKDAASPPRGHASAEEQEAQAQQHLADAAPRPRADPDRRGPARPGVAEPHPGAAVRDRRAERADRRPQDGAAAARGPREPGRRRAERAAAGDVLDLQSAKDGLSNARRGPPSRRTSSAAGAADLRRGGAAPHRAADPEPAPRDQKAAADAAGVDGLAGRHRRRSSSCSRPPRPSPTPRTRRRRPSPTSHRAGRCRAQHHRGAEGAIKARSQNVVTRSRSTAQKKVLEGSAGGHRRAPRAGVRAAAVGVLHRPGARRCRVGSVGAVVGRLVGGGGGRRSAQQANAFDKLTRPRRSSCGSSTTSSSPRSRHPGRGGEGSAARCRGRPEAAAARAARRRHVRRQGRVRAR